MKKELRERAMTFCIRSAFRVWVWTSIAILGITALSLVLFGSDMLFGKFIYSPLDFSDAQMLANVTFLWSFLGVGLGLMRSPKFRFRYGLSLILIFSLTSIYVCNFMERDVFENLSGYFTLPGGNERFLEYRCYFLNAPLWATFSKFLYARGGICGEILLWGMNALAFIFFFFILRRLLEKYGFGQHLAAILVFAFLLVNTPALSTYANAHADFHMVNLILLCYMFHSHHPLLSGIALALAVLLKESAVVMALPFLLVFDKKWCASFFITLALLAGTLASVYGVDPWITRLRETVELCGTLGESFRGMSVDTLVISLFHLFSVKAGNWVLLFKIPLLAGLVAATFYSIRFGIWKNRRDRQGVIWNSLPILFILMLLLSPIIQEHHFILMSVPFLLSLRKIRRGVDGVLCLFSWISVFVLPVFSFFPWSYSRLAGTLSLACICIDVCSNQTSPFFSLIRSRLDALFKTQSSPELENSKREEQHV